MAASTKKPPRVAPLLSVAPSAAEVANERVEAFLRGGEAATSHNVVERRATSQGKGSRDGSRATVTWSGGEEARRHTVYLPASLSEDLLRACREDGVKVSKVFEVAVGAHLAQRGDAHRPMAPRAPSVAPAVPAPVVDALVELVGPQHWVPESDVEVLDPRTAVLWTPDPGDEEHLRTVLPESMAKALEEHLQGIAVPLVRRAPTGPSHVVRVGGFVRYRIGVLGEPARIEAPVAGFVRGDGPSATVLLIAGEHRAAASDQVFVESGELVFEVGTGEGRTEPTRDGYWTVRKGAAPATRAKSLKSAPAPKSAKASNAAKPPLTDACVTENLRATEPEGAPAAVEESFAALGRSDALLKAKRKRGEWSCVALFVDGRAELLASGPTEAAVRDLPTPEGACEVAGFNLGGARQWGHHIPHGAYAVRGFWTVVASTEEEARSWLRWRCATEAEGRAVLAARADDARVCLASLFDPALVEVGEVEGPELRALRAPVRAAQQRTAAAAPAVPATFEVGQRVRVKDGYAGIDGVPVSLAGEVVNVASVGPKRVTIRPDGRGKTYAVSPRALEPLDLPLPEADAPAFAPPSEPVEHPAETPSSTPAYYVVSYPAPGYRGDWNRYTEVADDLCMCALLKPGTVGGPLRGFLYWHAEGGDQYPRAVAVVAAAEVEAVRELAKSAGLDLRVEADDDDDDRPRQGDSILRPGSIVRDGERRWRVTELRGGVRLKATEGTDVTTVRSLGITTASDGSGEFVLLEEIPPKTAPTPKATKARARKAARKA